MKEKENYLQKNGTQFSAGSKRRCQVHRFQVSDDIEGIEVIIDDWKKSSQKLIYVCFTEKSMTEKQNSVNKLTWLCLLLNYLIFQK